jgi:hypothetical protein
MVILPMLVIVVTRFREAQIAFSLIFREGADRCIYPEHLMLSIEAAGDVMSKRESLLPTSYSSFTDPANSQLAALPACATSAPLGRYGGELQDHA